MLPSSRASSRKGQQDIGQQSRASSKKSQQDFGQQAGSSRLAHCREQGVQVGSNPTMEQQQQTSRKGREMYPNIQRACKDVLLVLRGNKEYMLRLSNAFMKEKRIVANYGGSYVGMSDDIVRFEGDLYRGQPEACFALIRFKDMKGAEHWVQSSPIFKQADWPAAADGLELFAVDLSYVPLEDVKAFQMTEMHGLMASPDEFQEHYVKPVAKKLNERTIYHGVIATHKVNRLRNCMLRPDTYVLIHCADSIDKLKAFYDSPEYSEYREYRQKRVAETDSCFFTIKPITPNRQ